MKKQNKKNKNSKLKGNFKKNLDDLTGDFQNFRDVPNIFSKKNKKCVVCGKRFEGPLRLLRILREMKGGIK